MPEAAKGTEKDQNVKETPLRQSLARIEEKIDAVHNNHNTALEQSAVKIERRIELAQSTQSVALAQFVANVEEKIKQVADNFVPALGQSISRIEEKIEGAQNTQNAALNRSTTKIEEKIELAQSVQGAALKQSVAKIEEKVDSTQTISAKALVRSFKKIEARFRPLEGLGIILAVIAIVYAIRAEGTLDQIDSAVATRFIGSWPDHFPDVTKLVKNANKSSDKIWILGDYVGAWHYTRPMEYKEYFELIKNGPMKVQMLVFDKVTALDRLQKQFTSDHFCSKKGEPLALKDTITCTEIGYYEEAPEDERGHFDKYTAYLKYYRDNHKIAALTPNPTTYEGFLTLLLSVQDRLCEELTDKDHAQRIQIRTLYNLRGESLLQNYSYYYWIRNNDEMVLSFRAYNDVNIGSAFHTKDGQFLGEFIDQMKGRWSEATGTIRIAGDSQKPEDIEKMTRMSGYCYGAPVIFSKDKDGNTIHN